MEGSQALSILFVIQAYPPVIGGAEAHAARLATALACRGHTVSVVTRTGGPTRSDAATANPQVVCPPSWLRQRPVQRLVFPANAALSVLRGWRRFSLVHFFLPGPHTFAGICMAWLLRVPRVVTYGSSADIPILKATLCGRMKLITDVLLADRLVALNDEMRESFLQHGVPNDRIAVLPCSVDPDTFSPPEPSEAEACRARFGIAPRARVVAFVGRFVPEKRIPTLIAAFGRVASEEPAAVLVLAGDGPERAKVSTEIAKLAHPERVILLGSLPAKAVRDLLRASDVFALVSAFEGIPCALVEAMAVGLPSLVTEIAGTQQLVCHGETGVRVPVGDVDRIARELSGLLRDRQRQVRMGFAARQRVLGGYTSDIVARAHERLYFGLTRHGEA